MWRRNQGDGRHALGGHDDDADVELEKANDRVVTIRFSWDAEMLKALINQPTGEKSLDKARIINAVKSFEFVTNQLKCFTCPWIYLTKSLWDGRRPRSMFGKLAEWRNIGALCLLHQKRANVIFCVLLELLAIGTWEPDPCYMFLCIYENRSKGRRTKLLLWYCDYTILSMYLWALY